MSNVFNLTSLTHAPITVTYCILRGRIKGTTCVVSYPDGKIPRFFRLGLRLPPVLYLSYSTGRRYLCSLQYLLCTYAYNKLLMAWEGSLDPAPRAIFCIQHSLPCYNYCTILYYMQKGNATAPYYFAAGASYCCSSSLMAEMEMFTRCDV